MPSPNHFSSLNAIKVCVATCTYTVPVAMTQISHHPSVGCFMKLSAIPSISFPFPPHLLQMPAMTMCSPVPPFNLQNIRITLSE